MKAIIKIECPYCKGKGNYGSHYYGCSWCNGTGWIKKELELIESILNKDYDNGYMHVWKQLIIRKAL